MNRFALFLMAFAPLFAQNCNSSKKSSAAPQPLVGLEQHGCRGYCPMYDLTFWSDGKAEYEGKANVRKMGKEVFQLTPMELNDLKTRADATQLSMLQPRYASGIADAPPTLIVFWEEGKKHEIFIEGGAEKPAKLAALELFMKNLAEQHGLEIRNGIDPKAPDEASERTLIVELKADINAGNWLLQYEELKLKLKKRLRPERNLWLVAFDSAQIDDKSLIELFKTSPDVLLVQPNREVKDRD